MVQPQPPAVVPAQRSQLQQLLLNSGIILSFAGWLVVTYPFGNHSANLEHLFVGLILVLLGVVLLMLSTVAHQFPGAARAGAAVASAVLNYLSGQGL